RMTLKKILVTFFLSVCSIGLLTAGTVDPRFTGVWIGAETFVTQSMAFQSNFVPRTIEKDAVIAIDNKAVGIVRGEYPGRYEIMIAASANKELTYVPLGRHGSHISGQIRFIQPGRDYGKLVLSADGNTLTETG